MSEERAYAEGFSACYWRKPKGDNPYGDKSVTMRANRHAWDCGWDDAEHTPNLRDPIFLCGSWHPIVSAPRDGRAVLAVIPETEEHGEAVEIVCYGKHNHVPIYSWIYRSDRLGGEEVEGCEPTHWMPLPEPPWT